MIDEREVFEQAIELPPGSRAAFVRGLCLDDAMAHRVQRLIDAHERADETVGPAQPLEPAMPAWVGPYRILERLGEGGMGVVYLGEQMQPVRRRVALKVLKSGADSKDVLARFQAEQQALALMSHPNIARILEAGVVQQRPYFVMEYVPGVPTTEYCDRKRLSIRQRLLLFLDVCHGVQHAHQKGVIHRDLKPTNILVMEDEGVPIPKIIDFGIAKALTQPLTDQTVHTSLGQLIGTPEYMSPEQAEVTALDVDTRSDLYSLGAVLYELLVGARVFDFKGSKMSIAQVRDAIAHEEPERPSVRLARLDGGGREQSVVRASTPEILGRTLREDLDWITLKALDKDRVRRYASASEFAADLQRYLVGETVLARPPSPAYRVHKFVNRNRLLVGATATVLIVLVAGIVGIAIAMSKAFDAERHALEEAARTRLVASFLQQMLDGIDPAVAQGRDTTLLKQLLDGTARRISAELEGQPEVEAALRKTMGKAYRVIGEYLIASRHYARAHAIFTERLGAEHPETLWVLAELATTYWHQGRYGEAEERYLEVISALRRTVGDDSDQALRAMNNLAIVYSEQDRYDEAVALLHEVLGIVDRRRDKDDPVRLYCLTNLATVHRDRGEFAACERLATEVLERRRRTQGEDHPDTIHAIHNLATIHALMRRPQQAEALFLEAIEASKRVNGDDHPSTLNYQVNLAALYWPRGRASEAEALVETVLEHQWRRLGPEHADTLHSMMTLAAIYSAQERFDEAEAIHRKLVEVERRVLGAGHSDTLTAIYNLGNTLANTGRPDEAEPLLLEALEGHHRKFGDDHPRTQIMLRTLASLYVAQGRMDDARVLVARQLDATRRAAERPAATANDKNDFAVLLLTCEPEDLRDASAALELAGEACSMTGNTDPTKLVTLALAYHRNGDTQKAIEIQRRAIELVPDGRTDVRDHFESTLAGYRSALEGATSGAP